MTLGRLDRRCIIFAAAVALALLIVPLTASRADARRKARVATQSFRYLAPTAQTRARTARTARGDHPLPPPLIPLPPVRQHSASACGISCLQSVFAYYGKPSRRGSQFVRRAQRGRSSQRYSYAAGTPEGTMSKLARDAGLKVKTPDRMTLSELVRSVSGGRPVTVGIQAWVKNPRQIDWRAEQNAGHYVVAIGVGDKQGKPITSARGLARREDAYVWFMDPSADLGNRGYIPVKEFMDRWHWPAESGKAIRRFGMVITSGTPPIQTSFVNGVERIK